MNINAGTLHKLFQHSLLKIVGVYSVVRPAFKINKDIMIVIAWSSMYLKASNDEKIYIFLICSHSFRVHESMIDLYPWMDLCMDEYAMTSAYVRCGVH